MVLKLLSKDLNLHLMIKKKIIASNGRIMLKDSSLERRMEVFLDNSLKMISELPSSGDKDALGM